MICKLGKKRSEYRDTLAVSSNTRNSSVCNGWTMGVLERFQGAHRISGEMEIQVRMGPELCELYTARKADVPL